MAESDYMPYLIANSAKTDANFLQGFSTILDSYQKGQDAAYQRKMRNVFSDENGGLPRDPKSGDVDWGKAYERLLQVGGVAGIDQAAKLAETGFQQDRYRNAPTVQSILQPPQPQTASQPTQIFPPSTSRNAPAVVAPPLARGGLPAGGAGAPQAAPEGSWRGGDAKGSLIGFLSANGVPEQDQGAAANIIGGQLAAATGRRIDPNAPLDMNNPQVRQVLANFKRGGLEQNADPAAAGPPAQPQMAQAGTPVGTPSARAPQPQIAARPSMAPSVSPTQPTQPADPTLGGLIPPGYEPGSYVQRLEAIAGSGRVLPDQLKVLQGRIEAIHKAMEPTSDIKNARAAGMSVREYIDRNDNANTERAILSGSILPKLDKSQDTASAARDEILAIHRSREQLDAPGGIFSGTAADTRLKLAKVAEFLGVPNADKIANTEAFGSAIGSRTLSLVKGLGAGAGISNADRDFAAAMAGGNIKLDEKSIRRILDIGERAARARIDQHNNLAERTLKSSDALKDYGAVYRVEQPGQYQARQQAMPAPQAGTVFNGFKYLGGDPNDQRSWGRI